MNIAAEPMSRRKIREMTRKLRELLGFDTQTFFPIVHFIEWILANPEDGVELEIVEPSEMEDMYGVTNTGKNVMRIRSDVYERAVKGNPRDRFTLCHELGHYFLHQPDSMSYARGEIPKYRQPEWQANTFAGELMAPYHLVNEMSIDEIMENCGMSRQAATIQYQQYHKRCSGL